MRRNSIGATSLGRTAVPVDVLRCRVCESDYPAARERSLRALLRAARARLRLGRARDRRHACADRGRARIALALCRPAAGRPARRRGNGPGLTPLVAAPRLAARARHRRDPAEARPGEPDPLVQGPRRRRRRREGDRVRSRDPRGDLDRQPRERGRRPRGRDRPAAAVIVCPAGLEAEKLRATTVYGATVYAVRGSYDDCSRLVSELAGEVDWGIVNVNLRSYYAEGSKTLAFEICEQLGWETPDAVVAPDRARARCSPRSGRASSSSARLGLVDGDRPRLFGGQAEGCSPVASAFAEQRRVSPVRPASIVSSIAIGNPADGDLGDRDRRDVGRVDLRRARGRDRPEHLAARRDGGGVRRERRPAVAIGALREAVDARRARGARPGRRDRHAAPG